MISIYHNPRCSKSRAGLEYLKSKKLDFEIVEYLKSPLNEKQIEQLANMLDSSPEDLIRKQEDYYKKQLKGKNLNRKQWIKEIADNPKLLIRPIVVNSGKAVFAQPPEKIDEIL